MGVRAAFAVGVREAFGRRSGACGGVRGAFRSVQEGVRTRRLPAPVFSDILGV